MDSSVMSERIKDNNRKYRFVFLMSGIIVNVVLAYVLDRMGLPLFLDTVGTICVAAIGGQFYGIVAAVATNVFCLAFNGNAFYFAVINAFVAI